MMKGTAPSGAFNTTGVAKYSDVGIRLLSDTVPFTVR